MSIKTNLIKKIAGFTSRQLNKDMQQAEACQEKVFQRLIQQAQNTAFGKDHGFHKIKTYQDYKQQVALRDYEGLKTYIDLLKEGQSNILWPGKPRYFAKTSGTTSGAKFIPLSKASIPNHFGTARNAVFYYIHRYQRAEFMDGKMIFLSGSPALDEHNGIPTGRLSGISNHLIPSWLKSSQLPSYPTNCIDAWEDKLDAIVEETVGQDLRMISGIPPWVQMYYEKLLDYTGKTTILEVFPNLSLFVYGGVNFRPYRAKLESLTGGVIPSIETYPASEGFIAFQDQQDDEGLLLNINSGIFYEFIPLEKVHQQDAPRYSIEQVEKDLDYAILLNTNAGLWSYLIGDTVRFVSLKPYRILVTGRVNHFISSFGEHVIGHEVETALMQVALNQSIQIVEFTVAPKLSELADTNSYHEWFVEFDKIPRNIATFSEQVDLILQELNCYYKDLRLGNVLQNLVIRPVPRNTFREFMQSIGKLGGQNKVPRLSDDRKIASALQKIIQLN